MIEIIEGVKLISKKGKWDRYGITTASIINKCDGCDEENVPGIHVDNSGGEYTPATVCFKCLEEMKNSVNPV